MAHARSTTPLTVALFVATALAIGGCASQLAPAPEAVHVPGRGDGALVEAGGVRIVARANAWRSTPRDLQFDVTPLLVSIDNGSAAPLLVRYEHFWLDAPSGQRFAALAPYEITGTATELVPAAFVGRYLGPAWYPGFYDPYFYAPYVRRTVALPTSDMVQKALPEAVIERGGRASGFVYFERVHDVDRITLRTELVNARTGQRFGPVTIPFVVD